MNQIKIRDLKSSDKERLSSILIENEWEYHSGSKMTISKFEELFKNGYYTRQEVKTFMIEKKGVPIGFVRLFDLGTDSESDETPLFDIRIEEENRKKGFGTIVVNQVVEYVFKNYLKKKRIEATTRIDNKPMRQVLLRCNFVKEAHYRDGWNGKNGKKYDAIGYGILRRDWERGKITKLDWNT